ncbi:hypothetical protein [Streptomyces sp. NPDC088801]|uniref:hypothetical protein n=1 Tax=Streptomyces sp. NPDC088801 TaxID=3365903 RepID=UPI0037F22990
MADWRVRLARELGVGWLIALIGAILVSGFGFLAHHGGHPGVPSTAIDARFFVSFIDRYVGRRIQIGSFTNFGFSCQVVEFFRELLCPCVDEESHSASDETNQRS